MTSSGTILRGLATEIQEAHGLRRIWTSLRPGEQTDPIEHWEPYGFTARPPDSQAEALAVRLGGITDDQVVICVSDRRYRIQTLAAGEVALYDSRVPQQSVRLTATGIVVDSGTVMLGSAAAIDPVTLWPALQAWLAAHVHTGGTLPFGFTGPPSPIVPLPDCGAAKVFGE